MKIKVKQLTTGKWAAWKGSKYYVETVRDTERESRIARLQDMARNAQHEMDLIHAELEKLGAIDGSDPYGYLA